MTQPEFQGQRAPSFTLSTIIPDGSATALADEQAADLRRETEAYRTWNWVEAASEVGINESTLRKVWWEAELEPAFRYSPQPLRVVARTIRKTGREIFEFTAFGIEVLKAFKTIKAKGDRAAELFLAEAKAQYPAPATSTEPISDRSSQPATPVTVEVESGNHKVTLPPPALPDSYTLEGLRQIESIEVDDPLAIATYFLQAADQVQSAMQQDIEQREQKLKQTRQARHAIVTKAQELKLEQRLYQQRANQVAAETSEETQSLQDALSALQGLGKSPSPAAPPAPAG